MQTYCARDSLRTEHPRSQGIVLKTDSIQHVQFGIFLVVTMYLILCDSALNSPL